LLRDVGERKMSPTTASAALIANVTPPTIIRSLLFRLAGVRGPALPLVRAAAVLGDGTPLGLCAQLADITADEAAVTADELVKASIIHPGKEIAFAHPILRTAILADLGTHEHARWHARAADLLNGINADPQSIAVHLLRTEATANQVTVEILRRAADAAVRTDSPGAAAEYLARALAEPPTDDVVDALAFELGVAQVAVGHADGIGNVIRGTAATTDPTARIGRALTLAEIQLRSGQLEEAMAALDQARPYLDGVEENLGLRFDAARHWVGRQRVSTYVAARSSWDELRGRLDGPPSPARRELAVYLALDAVNLLPFSEASAMLNLGLEPHSPLESFGPNSFVVVAALLALHALERHDDFDRLANATLAEAGRCGAMLGYVHVSTMRSHELYLRGRLDDAEAEVEAAVQAAAPRGWEFVAPGLTAIRAIIALERARFDEIAVLIAQSAGDCEDPQDVPTGLLLDIRGLMRMSTGAVVEGLADVLRCGELMQALGVINPGIVPWRSHAAMGHLALGATDAAHDLAREDLALAQRLSGPVAIGGAQRVLGLATPGDDGIDLLRESVQTLAQTPARVETARALVDLGASLRRRGHPLAARDPLQQGLDLAAASGSAELETRARDELLASGANVRRRRPKLDELTPSEARVARLAATGMSNSAIAQSLFVTHKTVEKHLANTYRKLGIKSKVELDADRLDHTSGSDRS
jgi:DNA-binding NarL/FixJ family response regulator